MHQVLDVIEERLRAGSRPGHRSDGLRVVLSIEGGGMRGTVSAGMALALHELGLMSAFDAVYGSSAGAITGAWLLSSKPAGLRGWAHPDYARTMIRWSALLRRQPIPPTAPPDPPREPQPRPPPGRKVLAESAKHAIVRSAGWALCEGTDRRLGHNRSKSGVY